MKEEHFAKFCDLVDRGVITSKIAKAILEDLINGVDPERAVEEKGLKPLDREEDLKPIIEEVLKDNPKAVEDYKKGKKGVIGFLVGRVMKATKGRAHPQKTRELLEKFLDELSRS